MKKKILIILISVIVLLLLNDIIFLLVNKEVNYKQLKKDIVSIKKNNIIKYAIKDTNNKRKYNGKGYYIIKSKGTIKEQYSFYIKKKLIYSFNKIRTNQ